MLVAAGSGTRLGRDRPKAYVDCAGTSILERSLRATLRMREAAAIVIVAPKALLDETLELARSAAGSARDYVAVVAGGQSRRQSVARGLTALPASVEVVLVHDAARALTPPELFDRVVAAVDASGIGAIPGLPVTDTIKRIDASGSILGTVDRSALAAVQTPQGFPRSVLEAAYAAAEEEYTDDAALLAAHGIDSVVVAGEPLAFKITTEWDLGRAEQLLREESPAPIRVGIGTDVHGFDAESPLWLAGLHWPGENGLSGHSDGDPVAHAICDALLSAAGLGDIGSRFGTADPRFADAHGEVFLTATRELVEGAGFTIVNVAVQLIGNRPRFSSRRLEAERILGVILAAPVSVAATTSDGLGFTGRGEGVTAIATALLAAARRPVNSGP